MTTYAVPVTVPTWSFIVDFPSLDLSSNQEASLLQAQWLVRNDTAVWTFSLRSQGIALNLTDMGMTARASNSTRTLFSVSGSVTDVSNGVITVSLAATNTGYEGTYDCELTLIAGEQLYTFASFPLYVLKDLS